MIYVTLNHEIFNDAMERWLLVADAVPSLCQRHKILHGFWRRLTKQSNNNATGFFTINFYIEENPVSDRCLTSLLQQKI